MLPLLLPLIANLVPELIAHFGGPGASKAAAIAADVACAVAGKAAPGDAVAAIAADPALSLQFRTRMMENQERLAAIALEEKRAFLADVQDARKAFANDPAVVRLGGLILAFFGIAEVAALWGAYAVMQNGIDLDPGVVGAVMGIIGTTIGYLAAAAQQVIGYFYGSSSGAAATREALAAALQNFKPK